MAITPAMAALLKVVDVQELQPGAIPIVAGSDGDRQSDTTQILQTMPINDDKFRRINAKVGDAEIIPLGGGNRSQRRYRLRLA